MTIGPVQLILCSLKRGKQASALVDQLGKLQGAGTLRLVDLYVFRRNKRGKIQSTAVKELSTTREFEYGSIVRRLIGEKSAADESGSSGPGSGSTAAGGAVYGLSQAEIEDLMRQVRPGKTAALLLIEQTWSAELEEMVSQAGGAVNAQGFLNQEVIQTVSDEIVEKIGQLNSAKSKGKGTFEEAMGSLVSSAAARAKHEETALRAAEMLVEEQLADPDDIDEVVRIVAEAIRIEELLNE